MAASKDRPARADDDDRSAFVGWFPRCFPLARRVDDARTRDDADARATDADAVRLPVERRVVVPPLADARADADAFRLPVERTVERTVERADADARGVPTADVSDPRALALALALARARALAFALAVCVSLAPPAGGGPPGSTSGRSRFHST